LELRAGLPQVMCKKMYIGFVYNLHRAKG